MHRLFGLVALSAAGLALWVLFVGPAVDPQRGGTRELTEAPGTYSAWAVGLLMGLALAWLSAKDWGKLPGWLRLQRRRLGLLILGGGLLAGALLLL
jgi:hypothetical protein